MRKILLFLSFSILYSFVFSQENANSIIKADVTITNKLRATYEKPMSEKLSIGGSLSIYYGAFPGVKIEPFARYYFGSECPQGLYAQGRALLGSYSYEFDYWSEGGLFFGDLIVRKKNFFAYGVGLDLGYQWLSGKNKNIAIDLSLGIQLSNDINHSIVENGVKYNSANIGFNSVGPGAIFNPHIAIGYAF